MKTLRTLCVLVILSGVIFFGLKIDAKDIDNNEELAKFYHDTVLSQMNEVRAIADELETIVGKGYWPFPTYTDLLFSV